jgi:peptidoglycan/LPS O-acetylase OafA/YrhL/lysophospholipase L1-like esterase
LSSASSPRRIPHLTALDGLRGVGLLGVLLFHADGVLPGGYLGVDLFFVLSGYLITALLLAEHQAQGRIHLYAFWVRRCRRLLPALLALMPAVAAYGRFFARPEDLQKLRSQALATLGYVANWQAVFEHRSYWQLFSAPAPLEHTWSLSIEEQFYLVWPILVLLTLRRHGTRAVLLLSVLLTLASMAAMLLLFRPGDSSRAYLGTDTRMAGILAGAALATLLPPGTVLPQARTRWLDAVGAVATVGLAVAWCKLSGTSTFLYRGGFWLCELAVLALICCAVQGKNSLVARVFSLRPLVWLGTISYGVYLWHWPVNVLLSEERTALHGAPLQLLRIALSLGIAILSYRFIERPIRQNGVPFGRPQYLVPAAVTLAVFLVVRGTYARGGASAGPSDASESEIALHPDARYRVVLFGDSTANSLGWGLRALHADGVAVELLGKDGCTMLYDRCNGDKWAERVKTLRADAALIYLGGAFLHGFGVDGSWHTACYPDWDAKFERAMTERLRALDHAQGRVFVVTTPYPLGRYDNAEVRSQVDCINASLRKATSSVPNARLLDFHQRLCPQGICQRELPGKGLLRPDGVHFSIGGAEAMARWVLEQIQR